MPSTEFATIAAAFDPIISDGGSSSGRVCCTGESVWAEAGRRWRDVQGWTSESLHEGTRAALLEDCSGGALTTPAFALRYFGAVPTTFHILLGFAASATLPEALKVRLNVGGADYGAPVELAPGGMVPALTLADSAVSADSGGRGYAIPVPEYHEVRLVGAPTDGSVYAVGVRVSEAAARAMAARPSCAGGEVAFAAGCAMLPSEVSLRIPSLNFSLGGAGGASPPADPEQKLDQNRKVSCA